MLIIHASIEGETVSVGTSSVTALARIADNLHGNCNGLYQVTLDLWNEEGIEFSYSFMVVTSEIDYHISRMGEWLHKIGVSK